MLRNRYCIGLMVAVECLAHRHLRAQETASVALLRAMYPGVRVHNAGQNFRYFYGADMTPGATEVQAAAAFIAVHGTAFGGPQIVGVAAPSQLVQVSSVPSLDGDFVVFRYRQKIHGKDVDGSDVRVKVGRGQMPRVDFAAGRLAAMPTIGSEVPLIPAEIATFLVRIQPGLASAAVEGEPRVVVLRGSERRPDAWCWRIVTRTGDGAIAKRRVHYVDTSSPRILHTVDQFFNFEPPTTGTVRGYGTSAAYPYFPYQGSSTTLYTHPIPGIRVDGLVSGLPGQSVFANGNGGFSLSLGSTGQSIQLSASLEQTGQWYLVGVGATQPPQSPPFEWVEDTVSASVGDYVEMLLENSTLSEEFRVAQVDTLVSAKRARDLFLQYISDSVPGLAGRLDIYPNVPFAQALCQGLTTTVAGGYAILFSESNSLGGCWNLGSHSATCHEYGHVALLILDGIEFATTYPAFHEGYADTYGNMVNDDSVQGRSHHTDGTPIRDDPTLPTINCQYPLPSFSEHCSCGTSHLAGQLLSGPWVRIRETMKSSYGSSLGLARARRLFGNWSLVTLGGDDGCGSAHPGTLVEVNTVAKGSAEVSIVCSAFIAHHITGDINCAQ